MGKVNASNVHTSTLMSGFTWGVVSKVFDAVTKVVTIPVLVGFYGKSDYGLIALAFSLNAYLRLMDLGLNVGSIRFFSMWITTNEYEKISAVSKSSIVFYGSIGFINSIIFVILGIFSDTIFHLKLNQFLIFREMMLILAGSTIINWISNVFTQLLSAKNELSWINKVTSVSSILTFISAVVAVHYKLNLTTYFFLYTLSILIIVPFNIYRLKIFQLPILSLISPLWNWNAFREIMSYSISIFAMGFFQFTADSLRPLLLNNYSNLGVDVLTDYRIIQTISALVVSFGAIFLQTLLPSTSRLYAENNYEKLDILIYDGTKYFSMFLSLVIFILIANSSEILTIYMGSSYSRLSIWLAIWLLSLLGMHNGGVASLVLSSGNTKPLVWMSGLSCFLSLPVTVILSTSIGVGAAVIGYLIYVLLQNAFYYFYFIPNILKFNSKKLFFSSFLPSALIGLFACIITNFSTKLVLLKGLSIPIIMISKCVIFFVVFIVLSYYFVAKPQDFFKIKNKFNK